MDEQKIDYNKVKEPIDIMTSVATSFQDTISNLDKIIGNLPITENEDYPIMYGRSISIGDNSLCFQYGRIFKKIENGKLLYDGCRNNSVSFSLNVRKKDFFDCIQANSNEPYWKNYYKYSIHKDLRNPKFRKERKKIGKQMGIVLE